MLSTSQMNPYVAVCFMFVFPGAVFVDSRTDIGHYWHITDFHYDPTYWTDRLSCNDEVPRPGKFGDYWCDSPWQLVEDSIENLIAIKSDVDFIIWTGDNVAHIKDTNITENMYVNILRNITSAFVKGLFGVKVYPSLGNHDVYPTNQASPNGSRIYREVAQLWANWTSQAGVQLIQEGGYYMVMATPTVRLLALNTVLYFRSNNLTRDIDDPAGQMAWMLAQLTEARSQHQKVIVTGHVPPGLLVPRLTDWFNPRHKAPFVDLLLQFSDVIVAAQFGHDHVDSFKILQDKDGKRAIAHFSAPSVTPWRYKLPSEVGSPHNPGIRLIEFNRVTGQHINYVQYYMNLTESNSAKESKWAKLYSFKEAYNVADMSVASLRQIFSRLELVSGTEFADNYCTFSLVSNHKIHCTDKARAEIYCGGLTYDLAEAENCTTYFRIKNSSVAHSSSTVNIIGIFLLALLVFMIQYHTASHDMFS